MVVFCPPFKPASRRRRREVCSAKSLGQRLGISCGFQCAHRYSTGLSSSAGTTETPTQLDIATFGVDVIGDQAAAMGLQTTRSLRPGGWRRSFLGEATGSGEPPAVA